MAEGKQWLDVDVVRQHMTEATRTVGQFAEASYSEYMECELSDSEYTPALESPLEALFFIWWHVIADNQSLWGRRLTLRTQQPVVACGESYRLDFVLDLEADTAYDWYLKGLAWPSIAIEVDGHAFHERTQEQVALRNQRDRHLQQAGWVVFHFSWSEMTTRPLECVGEVLGVARQNYSRILIESYQATKAAESAAANQVGAPTSQES